MIADEIIDGQTPNEPPPRFNECRCNGLGYGGCRCEDDGSTWNNYAERDDHAIGGAPRAVRRPTVTEDGIAVHREEN